MSTVTGIHSVVDLGDGECSVWFDDPSADEGVLMFNVNVNALLSLEPAEIMAALAGWRIVD